LTETVDEKLHDTFSAFGTLMTTSISRDADTQQQKGAWRFVQYDNFGTRRYRRRLYERSASASTNCRPVLTKKESRTANPGRNDIVAERMLRGKDKINKQQASGNNGNSSSSSFHSTTLSCRIKTVDCHRRHPPEWGMPLLPCTVTGTDKR
jgi:hypothetical protein